MPRNPAAKKNQHNNRHENGLVGPGKRVTKQRSNGHLNGNTKPAYPQEPVPTHGPPDLQQHALDSSFSAAASGVAPPPALTTRGSESSADGQENRWEATNGHAHSISRRADMPAVSSRGNQDFSAIHIASTILRSCPAGDTVALLIVLLALPSMVLTVVQALFASLTLMPPTNVSPVAFLSFFDVFQGSTGSPSLGTMAVVDLICLGLWICLWNWAQNFALDLAQIQIAITLGNGNSGKNGTVNMCCFAIVLVLHCVRSAGVRRFFASNLIPANVLSNPRIAEIMQYLPTDADLGDGPGLPSKIRSLFAIHILSQAFMAFVRRRVVGSHGNTGTKSSKRADPETSAPSDPLHVDTANIGAATGVDFQPPPTPGFKDSKDRLLSAKKRRRQANQVRSRQPFWAALASTKVHVFREIEHGQGNRASSLDHQGSVVFQSTDSFCVVDVEPSSIQVETTGPTQPIRSQEEEDSTENKPFNVRINGAKWHSVQHEPLEDDRWRVTISGLAPDCTYTCSFGRVDDEMEIASVMVRTPTLQDGDQPNSLVQTPARGSLRPSSPTTTLRNSVQSAEVRLNEAKARLTKSKRSHKAAASRVEKEVESLNSRLKSSSDDTKQRQKLLQAERSMRQTEDATAGIEAELEGLQAIPEEELVDYEEKKSAHDDRNTALNTAQAAYDAAIADTKSQLADVNGELATMTSRKDRLKSRQEKLVEQHNRITEANARGLNEKERKAAETLARDADRQRRENDLVTAINGLGRELREVHTRITSDCREIESLERQAYGQAYAQREMMLNAGPLTPEGNLPGTNPPQPRTFAFGQPPSHLANSTLAPEAQSSPFLAYANTLPNQRTRSDTNQSNGAHSNYSGQDFEDADPIPPAFDGASNDRKSSGSSRGQNNASPAGVIGDLIRSPPRVTASPGIISQVKW